MVGRPIKFVLAACLAGSAFASTGAFAAETAESFMKAVNTNADKTVSMEEVDTYAMKRFDALDKNETKDDTLSMAEVGDRMSPEEFKAANTTHRNEKPTLGKAEWKAYVDKLFVEANTHVKSGETAAKGTLSVDELDTPPGQKLIHLLE